MIKCHNCNRPIRPYEPRYEPSLLHIICAGCHSEHYPERHERLEREWRAMVAA